MSEDSLQELQSALSQSIKREQVRKALGSSPTLTPEIKDQIRTNRKEFDSKKVATNIVENPWVVDDATEKLFTQIVEDLKPKHPQLEGIILKGSSALGGMGIRRAVNPTQNYETDADITIITHEESPVNDDSASLCNAIFGDIHKLVEEYKKPDNPHHKLVIPFPDSYHVETTTVHGTIATLKDIEDAKKLLYSPMAFYKKLLYFHPSCPPEINKNNSQLIKQAIQEIDDEDDRTIIINGLVSAYSELTRIKSKHFSSAYQHEKDINLKKTMDRNREVLAQKFRIYLETPAGEVVSS